jgi:DNA-binding NtrC family response regulator
VTTTLADLFLASRRCEGSSRTPLRVLESKRVTRVGANKEIEVDVRIIAATHRDLCERREDIGPLAARFLRRANQRNERAAAWSRWKICRIAFARARPPW